MQTFSPLGAQPRSAEMGPGTGTGPFQDLVEIAEGLSRIRARGLSAVQKGNLGAAKTEFKQLDSSREQLLALIPSFLRWAAAPRPAGQAEPV